MKVLAWNIRHGGGARIARIVEELTAHDPDVIALTEYRAAPGKQLAGELAERGWAHVVTTNPTGIENGIAVFSRVAAAPRVAPHPLRWLEVDLPGPITLCVLHIMAAGSSRTHP